MSLSRAFALTFLMKLPALLLVLGVFAPFFLGRLVILLTG
jgi:hypothetical protein